MPSPTFSFLNLDFSFSELLSLFQIPAASPQAFNLAQNWHSISYSYCKKHLVLPLLYEHKMCKVAMTNPFDFEIEKELAFMLDGQIEILYCPKEDLELWIDHYFHKENEKASQLFENLQDKTNDSTTYACYDLLDPHEQSAPSVRLLNFIIQEGITQKASDIHFEPVDNSLRIRYRIDGVLQNRHQIPEQHQAHIISRLKVMAQLDIAETRRPQDGRIKLKLGQREVDFRASTIPISSGERIVLRILDRETSNLNLLDLKMDSHILTELQNMIRRSEGILLVTGPTGSGKTTTLYAFLRQIYSPEMKIITIENPVEYRLPGIVQSQIDAERGFTFIHGLRAAVRQDPDIIMVGEIRDEETAQTAIDAALTGHLVFSTLHTNNAAGAYTRLIDLRVNPKIITSALTVSIGQRLARRLCDKCKKETAPSEKDKALMETILSSIKDREHPTVVDHVWTAPGCPECSGTGFRGRIGIYEAILSTAAIEAIVISNPSEREIRKAAEGQGILTLKQDGVMKILEGVTSVDEVNRVVDLSSIN